jgi:hypothetical protein
MPRIRHYWRKRLAERGLRLAAPSCDAARTLAMLSTAPQDALSWFDRAIAFLTTPFKRLGISGWEETGCEGRGAGSPVRDAQHSTDGFWTIDVLLAGFSVAGRPADLSARRYLRLEVEPGTKAHGVCAAAPPKAGSRLEFGGAIVVDRDGPFLEIHPDEDFREGISPPASRPGGSPR